jgi:hypothetical protein
MLPGNRLWFKRSIMTLGFEWDDEKAKANIKKYRVGFDEATED